MKRMSTAPVSETALMKRMSECGGVDGVVTLSLSQAAATPTTMLSSTRREKRIIETPEMTLMVVLTRLQAPESRLSARWGIASIPSR
jgi:hypothetical protein